MKDRIAADLKKFPYLEAKLDIQAFEVRAVDLFDPLSTQVYQSLLARGPITAGIFLGEQDSILVLAPMIVEFWRAGHPPFPALLPCEEAILHKMTHGGSFPLHPMNLEQIMFRYENIVREDITAMAARKLADWHSHREQSRVSGKLDGLYPPPKPFHRLSSRDREFWIQRADRMAQRLLQVGCQVQRRRSVVDAAEVEMPTAEQLLLAKTLLPENRRWDSLTPDQQRRLCAEAAQYPKILLELGFETLIPITL